MNAKTTAMPWKVESQMSEPKRQKKSLVTHHSCMLCGRKFQHFCSLTSHIWIDHKDAPAFTCHLCRAQFSDLEGLKSHYSLHEKKKFGCKFCKKKFGSSVGLKAHHMKVHSHLDKFKISCHSCDKRFVSDRGFVEHVHAKHRSAHYFFNFKCKICHKTFKKGKQCYLEKHSLSLDCNKLAKRANGPSCKECIIDYLELVHVAFHKHGNTADPVLIECQECFAEMDDFATICSHRHKGEPFRCLLCGEIVQSVEKVTEHTQVHMEVTPLTCKDCYKSFETKDLLENHIKDHASYKSFICGVCLKPFATADMVEYHINLHEIIDGQNGCSKQEKIKEDSLIDINTESECINMDESKDMVEPLPESFIQAADALEKVSSNKTIIHTSENKLLNNSKQKGNSVAQTNNACLDTSRKPNTLHRKCSRTTWKFKRKANSVSGERNACEYKNQFTLVSVDKSPFMASSKKCVALQTDISKNLDSMKVKSNFKNKTETVDLFVNSDDKESKQDPNLKHSINKEKSIVDKDESQNIDLIDVDDISSLTIKGIKSKRDVSKSDSRKNIQKLIYNGNRNDIKLCTSKGIVISGDPVMRALKLNENWAEQPETIDLTKDGQSCPDSAKDTIDLTGD